MILAAVVGLGLQLFAGLDNAVLPALLALRDYEQQRKQGLDPVFDPETLGIRNAGFWIKRR